MGVQTDPQTESQGAAPVDDPGPAELSERSQVDPAEEVGQATATTASEGTTNASEYDSLVLSALDAFHAGDWFGARTLFEQAHGIRPTARTLRTIGMCAFNQGDMIGALQNLEASLADGRKPLTVQQKGHVRALIRRADARVGRLRLVVKPSDASIRVDGKSPSTLASGEMVLDPGRHELVIEAQGHASRTQYVRVAARDRGTIEVALEPLEARPVAPADTVAAHSIATRTVQTPPAPPPRAVAHNPWAWLALGVGAVGVLGAGITTGLALGERHTLESRCPNNQCGPEEHGRVDDYALLRTVALTSLAVGAVGVGVGTVWLVQGSGEAPSGPRIEAVLTPGWAGVRGQL